MTRRGPRSHSGYVRWAMQNLGYTYGEAMEYADQRLAGMPVEQDSLFEDSEQRDASIPSQEDAGVARPHRQRPPAAPSKDSGRGDGDNARHTPRPEYDPRTSDWQGF